MIPEAPFLFSIAALSASLAGLAGLVAGLRREAGMRRVDLFRLREIVEFAFANVLVAVSLVPLALLTGETEVAIRIGGAAVLGYLAANALVLGRRLRGWGIPIRGGWSLVVGILALAAVALGVASVVAPGIAAWEMLLVVLLARPMVAFLLVLVSFEAA